MEARHEGPCRFNKGASQGLLSRLGSSDSALVLKQLTNTVHKNAATNSPRLPERQEQVRNS